jgi:hypothetical protein
MSESGAEVWFEMVAAMVAEWQPVRVIAAASAERSLRVRIRN